MAFVVEDGSGLDNATSYDSVAGFKAYWDDVGYSYVAFTDQQIQQALVKATRHIERFFGYLFHGYRLTEDQALSFPRACLYDPEGYLVEGVPDKLKAATNEYARRGLAQSQLVPDPTYDTTGQTPTKTYKRVAAIEIENTYTGAGSVEFRSYPEADAMLADYYASGMGDTVR